MYIYIIFNINIYRNNCEYSYARVIIYLDATFTCYMYIRIRLKL